MDSTEVSTMLRQLAATPAPLSTVDISRAAAAGRRRLRQRRALAGGAVVTGVVAVLAVAGLLAAARPTAGPAPAPIGSGSETPTPTPTLSATSMPTAAPERFDPLVQYAGFGWLPDGSVGSGVEIRDDLLQLSAEFVTRGEEIASAQVYIALPTAGRGVDPFNLTRTVDAAELVPGTPVDPVRGRTAVWLELPGQFTALRWEYAPDTWATVVVTLTVPGADADEVARRVAENVRYGIDAPIRLPFATTGVPASLPIASVHVSQDVIGWSAQLAYGTEQTDDGLWPLQIVTVANSVVHEPNTTVDGYPARTASLPNGGEELLVFDVDGIQVSLITHSAQATSLLPDGLEGLFRATEFYPDPADWR